MAFDITNNYWSVGDTSPGTQVFSSLTGAYVALADATYVAWLADGNTVTAIDTQANMYIAIADHAKSRKDYFLGIALIDFSGGNVTLTNSQLKTKMTLSSTVGASTMTLPQSNLPTSWPLGLLMVLYPNNQHAITVKKYDGTTLFVFPPVSIGPAGAVGYVMPMGMDSNDTTGGGWSPLAFIPAQGYAITANTYGGASNGDFQFNVSGITAGQTRSLTPPNADTTLGGLSITQTWTAVNTFSNTTDATSGSTGAIHTDGGIGAKKGIFGENKITAAATSGYYLGANLAFIQSPTSNYHTLQGPDSLVNSIFGNTTDKRQIHTAETSIDCNTGTFYVKDYAGATIGAQFATTGSRINKYLAIDTASTGDDGCVRVNKFFHSDGGFKRVSTQFDKTNDTTLADITGLSATLIAGKTYDFEAILETTSNIATGVQFAIAGTCTATTINYRASVTDGTTIGANSRATALGTAVGGVTAVTAAQCRITGTIVVANAGTLTVQFAENVGVAATTSSVLVGSTFKVWQVA